MHFTPKGWSFAYFSFLGVGKLTLAGLSNRRCRWHRRKIYQRRCYTGKQFFSGIADTGDKFLAFWLFLTGVNDTGEKCYRRCQRRRRWQRSALAAKLSLAAEVGHGRRYCHWNSHENAQSHLTNPDQRPRRPPKLLQTKTALFSFGGLRGLWSRCVGCFWMQLFMAVPMTPSAAVADFGGRRYRRFILFNFLLSLAAPHLHGVLVHVTGNKFIAGVVVTGDNCSTVSLSPATKLSPVSLSPATKLLPVSLSPVINCSPVSTTPTITENLWQRLIAGVEDTGNKFFVGVVDTAEQFNTGVIDTSDKQ